MLSRLAPLCALLVSARAREYNVAITGSDSNDGTPQRPLRSVQAAATLAQSGDIVTVHAGVYRERVHPPHGGVTFQAAPGDAVTLSGAEPALGWSHVGNDAWSLTLASYPFFGNFNPYMDRVRGDWFNAEGRVHHSGAVYLADASLDEAAALADVLNPMRPGAAPQWFGVVDGDAGAYLVNLLWISPRGGVPISAYITTNGKRYGTKPYNSTEGPCTAFIMSGDVLRFDSVDFGAGTSAIDLRAAAAPGAGATLEVRVGDRWGPLLGTVAIPPTGDWEKFSNVSLPIASTSGVQDISIVFLAPDYAAGKTTVYAQFPAGVDPNDGTVEINVRQTVLYPSEPGVDNITVRGFTLERAATQWAPPSAEQVGIVGTHWSKGWLIENNEVRHSRCSCISLGKYGDGYDNTNDQGQADPYTACVYRALNNGWHKDNVGSHVVRNNHVHHCGQTGVVGSLGGAFSIVEGNDIHDCHMGQTFSGAEMAGVKLHGAVDTVIRDNHIHNCSSFGIWLDWMAQVRGGGGANLQRHRAEPTHPLSPTSQGTMVFANLIHASDSCNIFTEVDHGPYTIANNILVSTGALCANSAGAAYVHNLIVGEVQHRGADARHTPSLVPHRTDIAALVQANNGDHRLYNNLLVAPGGFAVVNDAVLPCVGSGNVYTGAGSPGPSKFETSALVNTTFDAGVELTETANGTWFLRVNLDAQWAAKQPRVLVTTELLGNATIPQQSYTFPDNSSIALTQDYFNAPRDVANPRPGPLEASGVINVQVWPKAPSQPLALQVPHPSQSAGGNTFTIRVGMSAVSAPIPHNFVGVSQEINDAADFLGRYPLPPNAPFVQLMRNLQRASGLEGPQLRVGGNSAETSVWWPGGGPLPPNQTYAITAADLSSYAASVPLWNGSLVLGTSMAIPDPSWATAHVAAIDTQLGWGLVDAIEVGNEPEIFHDSGVRPHSWSFDDYEREFAAHVAAAEAVGLPHSRVQGAVFCCNNSNFNAGLPGYISRFAAAGAVNSVSYHRWVMAASLRRRLAFALKKPFKMRYGSPEVC